MGNKQIIGRKEAKALGLKRYFTGKPCCRGHISERWVSKCICVLCATGEAAPRRKPYRVLNGRWGDPEYRRKYRRQWLKENQDKVQKYLKADRERHPERMRKWNEWRKKRDRKISNLIAVLRVEMPELLKEFGL